MRKLASILAVAALALSWAGPLCAMAAPQAESHACCPGGKAPDQAPMDGACCRVSQAVPPVAAPSALPAASAVAPAAAPAVLAPASSFAGLVSRLAVAAPDAPPGASSGLSPPASGL